MLSSPTGVHYRQMAHLVRCATFVLCMLVAVRGFGAEDDIVELNLRIAWGGGQKQAWQGQIEVDHGEFVRLTPLGLDWDASRSFDREGSTITIHAPRRRSYEAIDTMLRARRDATLLVTLSGDGRAVEPRTFSLSQLISESQSLKLDDANNHLLVRRSPGDHLRVSFERPHLVFSPGDEFHFSVHPYETNVKSDTPVQLSALLVRARTKQVVWSEDREIDLNTPRDEQIRDFTVPIPQNEGAYDVILQIRSSRGRAFLSTAAVLAQRKLQLVSIAPESRRRDSSDQDVAWQKLFEFDPTQPQWWQRLTATPVWRMVPRPLPSSLGNQKTTQRRHQERWWNAINVDGWQAYPLAVKETGRPHLLQIEYPGDVPQSLGISLMETDASGRISPLGVDDVLHVVATEPSASGKTYELPFWPRTKTPYLLLTNRSRRGSAIHGTIRVLTAPEMLPPANSLDDAHSFDNVSQKRRLALAHFDRPLFPELFSATTAIDSESGRALKDWQTFHEGATRMIEYLRHAGYEGLSVSVCSEGSSIYPTRLIDASPKHDTGRYFNSGQDAVRKDIVEMLMRMCDRERITFILKVQFVAPIASLEVGRNAASNLLVHANGQPWSAIQHPHGDYRPGYNPLNERVQAAMYRVIEELAQRYGQHPSFGGVSIELGPKTYTHLPGEQWGYDAATIEAFVRETGTQLDTLQPIAPQLLHEDNRELWLGWRAQRLAVMYHAMLRTVQAANPAARLYMDMSKLVELPSVARSVGPGLPTTNRLSVALFEMGIAPQHFPRERGFAMTRPYRSAFLASTIDQGPNIELNASPDFDEFFRKAGYRSAFFWHQPQPLRLAEFDKVSPFGPTRTYTWLAPLAAASGSRARKRLVHHLALHDGDVFFDGGWSMVRGYHPQFTKLLGEFHRLPATAFQQAPSVTEMGQHLAVRWLNRSKDTVIYAVNDTAWPTQVDAVLTQDTTVQTSGASGVKLALRDGQVHWEPTLQPYDMAVLFVGPHAKVLQYTLQYPDQIEDQLRAAVADLRARAAQLAKPREMFSLRNPSFEAPIINQPVPAWEWSRAAGVEASIDSTEKHSGTNSLKLATNGAVAWVRSQTFESPKTRRLAAHIWMRPDPKQSPTQMRLVLDDPQQQFFRQVPLRFAESLPQNEWFEFELHVDDLPDPEKVPMLRLGVEIMGPATIWIDDVAMYDLAFTRTQHHELSKIVGLADLQLRQAQWADCQQTLERFWPRFLLEYVELEKTQIARPPERQIPRRPQPAPPPGLFERMRNLIPRLR